MRKHLVSGILAALAAFVIAAGPAAAAADGGITRVDASRFPTVTVDFSAPSASQLTARDVKVTENGKPVTDVVVTSLAQSNQEVDVVLVIDTSDSMRGAPLASAFAAARSFVQQLPASIRVGVLSFAAKPKIVKPITSDHAAVLDSLAKPPATGSGTALYDAVAAASRMFSAPAQRNIVVLTDGKNTTGQSDPKAAVRAARSAHAAVYSVGLGGDTDVKALEQLARGSGGRYSPAGTANLSSIYEGLATRISNQYLISYRSNAKPGSQLEIDVSAGGISDTALVLAPKGAKVHHEPPAQTAPSKPLLSGTWGLYFVVGASFLAAFLIAVMLFGTAERLRREHQMAARMSGAGAPTKTEDVERSPIKWMPGSLIKAGRRAAEAGGFSVTLDHKLEQAGLPLRAGEFVGGTALAALAGAVLGGLLLRSIVFVFIVAGVGGALPATMLYLALRKRSSRLHEQLADVLQILASSLRAGHSFFQALDRVAKEIPEPAATEFSRLVAEIRLGRPVDEALDALADRVANEDFKWATMAVNIQREVGGNLAEILDTVAETVRERDAIRREVDTLTIEGRLSMYILVALPVGIGLYMLTVNREYISLLWTQRVGMVMLGGAIGLVIAGMIWMRKIVKIDV